MNAPVDLALLCPVSALDGDDPEDTALLQQSLADARDYLRSLPWCRGVREEYFGGGVGGVVSVFLVRIEPGAPDVDEWMWVITGDVPAAYLVCDSAPTPAAALEVYGNLMMYWVEAARTGKGLDDAFPVPAEPTAENADVLEERISLLRTEILPLLEG